MTECVISRERLCRRRRERGVDFPPGLLMSQMAKGTQARKPDSRRSVAPSGHKTAAIASEVGPVLVFLREQRALVCEGLHTGITIPLVARELADGKQSMAYAGASVRKAGEWGGGANVTRPTEATVH